MRLDNFYFVVSNIEKSIEFYEKLFNEKQTNVVSNRWADWRNSDNQIYFGIISKEGYGDRLIKGNNGVLGLYVDDINSAFEKCKSIGAKIIYEPQLLPNSEDHYTCFAIEDIDGNKIEIAYYDK